MGLDTRCPQRIFAKNEPGAKANLLQSRHLKRAIASQWRRPSMSPKTLYERLSGYDAISALSNDLVDRLRKDPQLFPL
jgi:hypothetical protein